MVCRPLSEPPYWDRLAPEAERRLVQLNLLFRHFMYCQLRAPLPPRLPLMNGPASSFFFSVLLGCTRPDPQ